MKVTEVLAASRRQRLSPMQRKVLQYLEAHPDEVFPYRDVQLMARLALKPSALGFTLWHLRHQGLIASIKADKTYFGSKQAIGELERRLQAAPRP